MSYSFLHLDVADRIATITINRPDKLNALNVGTVDELDACMTDLGARDDIGAIVVTGAGRAFAAGADIAEIVALGAPAALAFARRGQAVFRRFESSRKPTIAAVNGFALGGGCELAMSCHVRVAADNAKLGQPEVKLGLAPGYGGTQRLPRLVGRGRALQLLMTGEAIDAAEAYRIGLVNRVVPAGELLAFARALAVEMLKQAPLGLAACIEAVDVGLEHGLDAGLAVEANAFGILCATADMKEGTAAFLAKRTPTFTGR
jgi:enoyl-CoA hydratase